MYLWLQLLNYVHSYILSSTALANRCLVRLECVLAKILQNLLFCYATKRILSYRYSLHRIQHFFLNIASRPTEQDSLIFSSKCSRPYIKFAQMNTYFKFSNYRYIPSKNNGIFHSFIEWNNQNWNKGSLPNKDEFRNRSSITNVTNVFSFPYMVSCPCKINYNFQYTTYFSCNIIPVYTFSLVSLI